MHTLRHVVIVCNKHTITKQKHDDHSRPTNILVQAIYFSTSDISKKTWGTAQLIKTRSQNVSRTLV